MGKEMACIISEGQNSRITRQGFSLWHELQYFHWHCLNYHPCNVSLRGCPRSQLRQLPSWMGEVGPRLGRERQAWESWHCVIRRGSFLMKRLVMLLEELGWGADTAVDCRLSAMTAW